MSSPASSFPLTFISPPLSSSSPSSSIVPSVPMPLMRVNTEPAVVRDRREDSVGIVSTRRRAQQLSQFSRGARAFDVIPNGLFPFRPASPIHHPPSSSHDTPTPRSTSTSPTTTTRSRRRRTAAELDRQRARIGKIARVVGLTVLSSVFILCLAILLYLSPPNAPPPFGSSSGTSSRGNGSGAGGHGSQAYHDGAGREQHSPAMRAHASMHSPPP